MLVPGKCLGELELLGLEKDLQLALAVELHKPETLQQPVVENSELRIAVAAAAASVAPQAASNGEPRATLKRLAAPWPA